MGNKAGIVGYTIELRDTGRHGFVLPKDQIVPMGEEVWNAMRVFIPFVLDHDIPTNVRK
jgi:extracellular matrix protein 14